VLLVNASNRVEHREVKLGIQTATRVEILSGLNENDTIIFGAQNQFKNGELVSPRTVAVPGME
jgi:multidrug efflux pump subunit AcrA (membrane-fusion protein)